MTALKSLAEPKAVVLRDGVQSEISVEQIVRGDMVFLDTGKFIPADIRIVESPKLRVDESALTGESLPVDKHADKLADSEMMLGDQKIWDLCLHILLMVELLGLLWQLVNTQLWVKLLNQFLKQKLKEHHYKKINSISNLNFNHCFGNGNWNFLIKLFNWWWKNNVELIAAIIFSISAGIALIPESIMIIVTISLSVSAKKWLQEMLLWKLLMPLKL
nr:hypothetical protein [Spiroplasma clarkii]